jgi:hypothetical protein
VRIPGAATLLFLGLLILWLAVTGKLDRLWSGYDVATGKAPLPASTDTTQPTAQILDPATYHYGTMLHALTPGVAIAGPGSVA